MGEGLGEVGGFGSYDVRRDGVVAVLVLIISLPYCHVVLVAMVPWIRRSGLKKGIQWYRCSWQVGLLAVDFTAICVSFAYLYLAQ